MGDKDALRKTLQRNIFEALRKKSFSDANSILLRLKEIDPFSKDTRGLEFQYLIRAKKFSEANKLVEQLIRNFPDSSKIILLAGELNYNQQQYANAHEHFVESDRLYPNPIAKQWIGRTLTQLGRLEEAISILEELKEKTDWARIDLAWAYERSKNFEFAIRELKTYLKEFPDNQFAQERLLKLKAQTQDPSELISEMERLEDLGGKIPPHLLSPYIEKLLGVGQQKKAEQLVKEYKIELPINICLNIAWIYYHAQIFNLALEIFMENIDHQLGKHAFLAAIEKCAKKCQQTDTLIARYQELAPKYPKLRRRIKKFD